MIGSVQGEHIFNAVGDLAKEIAATLAQQFAGHGTLTPKMQTAQQKVQTLQSLADQFITARNHEDFRTGDKGDPANVSRYSSFVSSVRKAVPQMLSGNPSEMTAGYTALTKLANDIEHSTIDQTAMKSAQSPLSSTRRTKFDQWFTETVQLLHSLFKALIDAVQAVSAMHTA